MLPMWRDPPVRIIYEKVLLKFSRQYINVRWCNTENSEEWHFSIIGNAGDIQM